MLEAKRSGRPRGQPVLACPALALSPWTLGSQALSPWALEPWTLGSQALHPSRSGGGRALGAQGLPMPLGTVPASQKFSSAPCGSYEKLVFLFVFFVFLCFFVFFVCLFVFLFLCCQLTNLLQTVQTKKQTNKQKKQKNTKKQTNKQKN